MRAYPRGQSPICLRKCSQRSCASIVRSAVRRKAGAKLDEFTAVTAVNGQIPGS